MQILQYDNIIIVEVWKNEKNIKACGTTMAVNAIININGSVSYHNK